MKLQFNTRQVFNLALNIITDYITETRDVNFDIDDWDMSVYCRNATTGHNIKTRLGQHQIWHVPSFKGDADYSIIYG